VIALIILVGGDGFIHCNDDGKQAQFGPASSWFKLAQELGHCLQQSILGTTAAVPVCPFPFHPFCCSCPLGRLQITHIFALYRSSIPHRKDSDLLRESKQVLMLPQGCVSSASFGGCAWANSTDVVQAMNILQQKYKPTEGAQITSLNYSSVHSTEQCPAEWIHGSVGVQGAGFLYLKYTLTISRNKLPKFTSNNSVWRRHQLSRHNHLLQSNNTSHIRICLATRHHPCTVFPQQEMHLSVHRCQRG
jgi:hypothetical protein